MSPSRHTIRIRPRSAIADPALARAAVTDLPGVRPVPSGGGHGPRAVVRAVRSMWRPMEPERVIVMPLAAPPVPGRHR